MLWLIDRGMFDIIILLLKYKIKHPDIKIFSPNFVIILYIA